MIQGDGGCCQDGKQAPFTPLPKILDDPTDTPGRTPGQYALLWANGMGWAELLALHTQELGDRSEREDFCPVCGRTE